MLQLLSATASLQKEIFFPIPRNRRRYVRIRSVRSYELHDIFFISRSRFLAERNESEEIVMFRAQYFIMNIL